MMCGWSSGVSIYLYGMDAYKLPETLKQKGQAFHGY